MFPSLPRPPWLVKIRIVGESVTSRLPPFTAGTAVSSES